LRAARNASIAPPQSEDSIRVIETNHFVVLQQVDAIHAQSFQGLVQLPCSLNLRAAVDLRHDESLPTVAIAKRFAQALLAFAAVVVPRVVHEIQALVERRPDDTASFARRQSWLHQMRAAESQGRNLHARVPEPAIRHFYFVATHVL
jgi:hypothetical protein